MIIIADDDVADYVEERLNPKMMVWVEGIKGLITDDGDVGERFTKMMACVEGIKGLITDAGDLADYQLSA